LVAGQFTDRLPPMYGDLHEKVQEVPASHWSQDVSNMHGSLVRDGGTLQFLMGKQPARVSTGLQSGSVTHVTEMEPA